MSEILWPWSCPDAFQKFECMPRVAKILAIVFLCIPPARSASRAGPSFCIVSRRARRRQRTAAEAARSVSPAAPRPRALSACSCSGTRTCLRPLPPKKTKLCQKRTEPFPHCPTEPFPRPVPYQPPFHFSPLIPLARRPFIPFSLLLHSPEALSTTQLHPHSPPNHVLDPLPPSPRTASKPLGPSLPCPKQSWGGA